MSAALLMCDYQEAWSRPGSPVGEPTGIAQHATERGVLALAAELLTGARANGWRIAHTRVAFEPAFVNRTNRSEAFGSFEEQGFMLGESAPAQICPELAPLVGEPVYSRGWVNPFAGTSLPGFLNAHRASTLFIAGIATNFVVESAVRAAADAGFDVVVVEDACATYSEEMHRFAVESIFPTFGRCLTVNTALEEQVRV